MEATGVWRCAGLRWREGRPTWSWWHPRYGERSGAPLRLGDQVALALPAGAERLCGGVLRSGRRTACPSGMRLPGPSRRDQCEDCSALDRMQSVAADTMPDDPRPYAVYLAWFAPGLTKVGITGDARGSARLLEQAAVCYTFLGRGPLMAARRTEAVLCAALGIPDRVTLVRKRAARFALPAAEQRLAELRRAYEAALSVRGWADSLTPAPFEAVDHGELFGLARCRPTGRIPELQPGGTVSGELRSAAGCDLYLDCAGEELLLDAQLAACWPLQSGAPGAPLSMPVESLAGPAAEPLF